ncbi:hypothetical protein LTR17_027110, partial [Elasticomyces elasticus]
MSSVQPMQTIRTHEENRERAYIAASRRSDRGLEARVKSARRASEIHKQRTGRSLRVTEQDVIDEEIYEEERDDLTTQYRRITAYLQNANADFNKGCQSYLSNHVPMPQVVDDAALFGVRTNCQPQSLAQPASPPYMRASHEQLTYRGSMMPLHMPNRAASQYGHQRYPLPQEGVQKLTKPSYDSHGCQLSLATLSDSSPSWQLSPQSAQSSPVNEKPVDLQWIFPTPHIVLRVRNSYPQGQIISPGQTSQAVSRDCSISNAATLDARVEQSYSSQQKSALVWNTQQQPSLQPPQQEPLASPLGPIFDPQSDARMTPPYYDATCEVPAGHCGLRDQ